VSGVLGLAVGIGGTVLAVQSRPTSTNPPPVSNVSQQLEAITLAAAAPGRGGPPAMGGGAPPMGMGMGMGMGMMGMGGGGGGKRNLTSLVGKLELLSRPALNLRVELDPEQVKSIAEKLAAFDAAETMTADEAQTNLEALEALLTPEQKETLAAIGMPPGGQGGGQRGGGGPPGGGPGGPPGGPPMGMMMGMGGGSPDANPFAQETNQKRLRDLLARLQPADAAAPAESQ
jgi:hypothetical protein